MDGLNGWRWKKKRGFRFRYNVKSCYKLCYFIWREPLEKHVVSVSVCACVFLFMYKNEAKIGGIKDNRVNRQRDQK